MEADLESVMGDMSFFAKSSSVNSHPSFVSSDSSKPKYQVTNIKDMHRIYLQSQSSYKLDPISEVKYPSDEDDRILNKQQASH